jgi:tetratricopeptide (TPR) repeat protein
MNRLKELSKIFLPTAFLLIFLSCQSFHRGFQSESVKGQTGSEPSDQEFSQASEKRAPVAAAERPIESDPERIVIVYHAPYPNQRGTTLPESLPLPSISEVIDIYTYDQREDETIRTLEQYIVLQSPNLDREFEDQRQEAEMTGDEALSVKESSVATSDVFMPGLHIATGKLTPEAVAFIEAMALHDELFFTEEMNLPPVIESPFRSKAALEEAEMKETHSEIPFEKKADESIREEVKKIAEAQREEPIEKKTLAVAKEAAKPTKDKAGHKVSERSEIRGSVKSQPSISEIPEMRDSEEHSEDRRMVYARVGDDIEISFDKEGWLFLGYKDQKSSEAIAFQTRQYREGSTVFVFSARKLGAYDLPFLFQENYSGSQEKMIMGVLVLEDDEFDRRISEVTGERQSEAEDLQYAERLTELGQYEKALGEFLKRYRDSSPYLNDRIADLYLKTGQFNAAMQYWMKNWQRRQMKNGLGEKPDTAGATQEYSNRAISGIIRTCIAMDDHPTLLQYTEPLLSIDGAPIEREIIMLVRYLIDKKDFRSARETLQRYLRARSSGGSMDEILFLIGRIYEEDTEHRNYKMARDTYTRVYTEFPESFFADSSKEKVDFLNRHFLFVR